jgi:hypothetical protein
MSEEEVMSEKYQPIPVSAAAEIAERFAKSIVVITAYDRQYELTHTTTYGRDAQDKLDAAAAGEYLHRCAGGDLSKREIYEDFRDPRSPEFATAVADAQRDLVEAIDGLLISIAMNANDRIGPQDEAVVAARAAKAKAEGTR